MRHHSRFALPLLTLCLTVASASAQSNAAAAPVAADGAPAAESLLKAQQKQMQTLAANRAALACPVGLSVQRVPQGAVVWTNDRRREDSSAEVELHFKPRSGKEIVKAEITVHGTSGMGGIMPVAIRPNDSITETFTLERTENDPTLSIRNLRTKSMATVSWVELTRIEFATGTVWTKAGGSSCVAVPSAFLLVSGR